MDALSNSRSKGILNADRDSHENFSSLGSTWSLKSKLKKGCGEKYRYILAAKHIWKSHPDFLHEKDHATVVSYLSKHNAKVSSGIGCNSELRVKQRDIRESIANLNTGTSTNFDIKLKIQGPLR